MSNTEKPIDMEIGLVRRSRLTNKIWLVIGLFHQSVDFSSSTIRSCMDDTSNRVGVFYRTFIE